MGDVETAFSAEDLVALLADAGEIDAGVDVLDALRVSDGGSPNLLRLQARLFLAATPPPEKHEALMARLRDGCAESLAKRGALLEAGVALRVLTNAYPEEPAWAHKLARVDEVLQPLPGQGQDPRRAEADALIALGRAREAWELLRELSAESPRDRELARRADALRMLLFEPLHSRPPVLDETSRTAVPEVPQASTENEVVVAPAPADPDEESTRRRASLPEPASKTVEVKRRRIVRLG